LRLGGDGCGWTVSSHERFSWGAKCVLNLIVIARVYKFTKPYYTLKIGKFYMSKLCL
jgi:hypothetical protein